MKPSGRGLSWRRALVGLGIGCGAAFFSLGVSRLAFFRTLEWKIYDQHVRWTADPAQARRDIILIDIDETSIRRLEPVVGRWPWPRLVHAALIDFLARAPARVIAYDVLFTERDLSSGFEAGGQHWTGEESDSALASSVARAGAVVLLGDATYEGLQSDAAADDEPASAAPVLPVTFDERIETRPHFLMPYDALARGARGIGHNYFVLDPDGPLRRIAPFVRLPQGTIPSLGVAAVIVGTGLDPQRIRLDDDELIVGGRRVPVVTDVLPRFENAGEAGPELARRLLVDYRGPPVLADGVTTTYKRYAFYDLFYSEQQLLEGQTPLVDPAQFRDAYVFVGTTAAGLHDVFVAPFGEGGKMPGAQVHASVADQLLSGRGTRALGWRWSALAALLSGVLVGTVFVFLGPRWASQGLALVVVALAAGSIWLFSRGVWLPPGSALLSSLIAGVAGLAFQYLVEGREKRAVKRLFSRYLSRDIYEQVLANPALAELGGKRRDMSVLFSDIRGFTAVTEKGDPEELVAQLNQYFSRMVEVVFEHRGTLDKFVGDMVMALYGAPLDDPDHADHAVETALAMVAELDRLNRTWQAEGRPTLGIGIGINSGDMIAGNIGSERIRSYTVIGDHVNLGARLESLNKEYKTSIIISEYTAHRLKARYDLHPLGSVVVKGKSVAVEIFEVRARTGSETDRRPLATRSTQLGSEP